MTRIDTGKLGPIILQAGSTMDYPHSMCVMQAVALITGETERHTRFGTLTDRPSCVDPSLTLIAINANDNLHTDERQALKSRIPRLIDTRGDGLEQARDWLMADFIVHELVPYWMAHDEQAVRDGLAERVAAIPAVTDDASLIAAERALNLIDTNLPLSDAPWRASQPKGSCVAWRVAVRNFTSAVLLAKQTPYSPMTMAQTAVLSASSRMMCLELLDRLLALSDTPLDSIEAGSLGDAPQDDEAGPRQAAFLETLSDLGYTPFPAPEPNSFMCLEN